MLSTKFDSTLRTPEETLVVSISLDDIAHTGRYVTTQQRTSYDKYSRIKSFEYYAACHLNLGAAVAYFSHQVQRIYYIFQEMIDHE